MDQTTAALPLIALRGLTVVPNMIIHFDLSRDMSIKAVEQALDGKQKVLLVPQMNPDDEKPDIHSLYKVCTLADVKQVTKLPNHIVRVMVEGVARARIVAVDDNDGQFFSASYEEIIDDDAHIDVSEKEALIRTLKEVLDTYVRFFPKIGTSLGKFFKDNDSLPLLMNQVMINIPLTYEQKQQILEIEDVDEQCRELITLILDEAQIASIRAQLAVKVKERIDKNQRDYILHEQLEFIQEELGDNHQYSDVKHFEEALAKLKADADVKEKIKKEIARFKAVMGSSSESVVERGYIETLWNSRGIRHQRITTTLTGQRRFWRETIMGLRRSKSELSNIWQCGA